MPADSNLQLLSYFSLLLYLQRLLYYEYGYSLWFVVVPAALLCAGSNLQDSPTALFTALLTAVDLRESCAVISLTEAPPHPSSGKD